MKVLALASYPVEAAATRYRVAQFIAPLRERGIEVTLRPLLDGRTFTSLYRRADWPRTAGALAVATLRRLADIWRARKFDAVFVQREALLIGPPLVEWLVTRAQSRPLILDLDDATYVRYVSQNYGRLSGALKWFSKTDDLIRWAKIVTCGNRAIAEYVHSKGARATVIPTVVDTTVFCPKAHGSDEQELPVLGWVGTHSTYPFLETLFPVLERLARSHRFRLKIVGAGQSDVSVPGVEVENLAWSLEREVRDFQSFDIGLYPITVGGSAPQEWAVGKSGFKAVQYMAVGIPYVSTPIGTNAEIGEAGVTHFNASSQEEWADALARLLSDADLRRRMGVAGRRHALAHYTVAEQADKLAEALRLARDMKPE